MPMSLQMPAQIESKGFGVSAEGVKDAIGAGAPIVQANESLKAMGEQDQQKQKALQYQQLLRSGADGMREYAGEVGKEFPDLGTQLTQEAEHYASFFSDPSLTGDKAEEYAHHFYESANNRVKAMKDAKIPKPVVERPWAPHNQQEAEDYYRFKKETDADNRPAPRTGPGSKVAAEKKMTALRELPALWSQIEEMQRTADQVPLVPGKSQPDTRAFVEGQPKAWRAKWDELRKKLNASEAQAGLEASVDIMGPDLDKSASYKLYQSVRSKGPRPGGTAPVTPAAPTSTPAQSENSTDAALAWLKDPASKKSKHRDAVIQELKKSGVDTSGL